MVQFSQSPCHFRSSLRRGSSHLLMEHVNSNQIQLMLLERAQARNSQGCANLTAGTVRMYGWAHAHIKVRIVKYGENSCKKWCCMVCHKTLLVRLPYYKSSMCCVQMAQVNQGTVLMPQCHQHTAQFSACEPVHSSVLGYSHRSVDSEWLH